MSLRWRIWHIYRWRLLATVFGAISDRVEAFHDRWHPAPMDWCEMCTEPRW